MASSQFSQFSWPDFDILTWPLSILCFGPTLLKTRYRVLRFGLSRPRGGRVDRRAKVELFEQIRSEYEHGGGTIRGIAKELGDSSAHGA
jgi:hypothetical protein